MDDPTDWTVRGLPLPPLLVALLQAGGWHDRDEAALRVLMPWFADPLIFPNTLTWMRHENTSIDTIAADEDTAEVFRLLRGGSSDLPWLDVDQAVLIAVNRNAGDDVALALDYRSDVADPRVVASDIWTDPARMSWRLVTPTFSELVTRLGHAEPPVDGPA